MQDKQGFFIKENNNISYSITNTSQKYKTVFTIMNEDTGVSYKTPDMGFGKCVLKCYFSKDLNTLALLIGESMQGTYFEFYDCSDLNFINKLNVQEDVDVNSLIDYQNTDFNEEVCKSDDLGKLQPNFEWLEDSHGTIYNKVTVNSIKNKKIDRESLETLISDLQKFLIGSDPKSKATSDDIKSIINNYLIELSKKESESEVIKYSYDNYTIIKRSESLIKLVHKKIMIKP